MKELDDLIIFKYQYDNLNNNKITIYDESRVLSFLKRL